ncbi:hypothetical protein [Sphaerimonospora thailandensis]|uniref:Uncharacterized protein n=1 Tax=Sphaerimonospora thailandensis TaxID=795644 RepID=A0A8J3R6X2_9ACTN|nr:hypothetical protein [Sphaerimonospora thailandensis]GIH69475.1 hypothetical protein Mth01_17280 [Sphaerimonospora thailandensis]
MTRRPIPGREVLAATVRQALDAHEWDTLHEFRTLHWDGEQITTGTLAAIDPSVHPTDYPALMVKVARTAVEQQQEVSTLHAFLLLFEAHAVMAPSDDASDDEQARFQRDRLERRFYQREDAVELATAYCADIHGRLWSATRRRDTGAVEQHFYPTPEGAPGGAFVNALRAVAQAAGAVLFGQVIE